jgi:hypothetical protein
MACSRSTVVTLVVGVITAEVLVDGKNSFSVSIGLASVQVTYALLHLQEIPRFVNPQSKGIASA